MFTKPLAAALFAVLTLAVTSCGPLPEATDSNPLNTPGDVHNVPYTGTDIHHRLFGRDYGHR